ncbi:LLM class flavin-dependent oxidoreductase [Anoxybacillus sp. UARK-01]|uniref:LLM class flavin-dependent oxidoreductase n=1 Tax=Anoxybacillus sp. UARK-01 TaxID=1895648 RepID=UPI001F2BAD47|nr:LLM class flavin-dependent oxidoreductase [Anoxybacillus sp. UARK-01]
MGSLQFSIWGSNLSGGFLRARVEENQEWSFDYNRKLVKTAEQLNVASVLFPVRYIGSIGGHSPEKHGQLDPLAIIAALAAETKRIHLIAAVLPAFIHPATLAKIGATIDRISNGRFHINLVSGWFKQEQEAFGLEWIAHEERYKRSIEYLEVLKGLWTQDHFSFDGTYYKIKNATLLPKPTQKPYPAIYQGGNSKEAQEMAGRLSDYYFMNGAPIEELKKQIQSVRAIASRYGRWIKFAVNAFVIARATTDEALSEYQFIIDNADEAAIEQLQKRTETKGMWKNASVLPDFVANNEGFRTGLIGSYKEVAEKINALQDIGIDKVLLTFRFPLVELPEFYDHVVPLLHPKSVKYPS